MSSGPTWKYDVNFDNSDLLLIGWNWDSWMGCIEDWGNARFNGVDIGFHREDEIITGNV